MPKAKSKPDAAQIRDEILKASLSHAAFDGWNRETLKRGAGDAGYGAQEIRALFPLGVESALDDFADLADRWMLEALEETDPKDLKIRERIRAGVLARLQALEPHKEAVHASLRFWSKPGRQGRAGKIVWRTADTIWSWAGDTSEDYNHYTKRGLLSGILASTIVVWCQDNDPEMKRTTRFLDARIQNVMDFGRIIGTLKKFAPFQGDRGADS